MRNRIDRIAKRLSGGQTRRLQALLAGFILIISVQGGWADSGSISGKIIEDSSYTPLPSVSVSMPGRNEGTVSDSSGRFLLGNLAPGRYWLRFSHVGYDNAVVGPIDLAAGADTSMVVSLHPHPVSVRDITVTPGTFSIMGTEPVSGQTLTREDIQSIPHFGEDIYRAVTRLPGVTANDFSARFSVRGSEHEQILGLFDGLQLYEPFHLRDVDGGALSIIDIDLIQGVELMTGGFSAAYGDRLGGVFSITPRAPSPARHRVTGGVSFTDAHVSAEGPIASGRGGWLVSARRGYVDLVQKLMDEDTATVSPVYYDTYASVQYRLTRRHMLSLNFLYGNDKLIFSDEQRDSANTRYSNGNFWVKLRSGFSRRLAATSILRTGSLTHHRIGISYDTPYGSLQYKINDYRNFRYQQIKEDVEVEMSRAVLLQGGVDLKAVKSDYDYRALVYVDFLGLYRRYNRLLSPAADGRQFGSYLSARVSPVSSLTLELGMRYDTRSYTGDRLLSPRSSLVLRLSPNSSLRFAWGRYAQSQELYALDIPDGDSTFHPADIAEHRVLGFEHEFSNKLRLRIEAYYRGLKNLRPRYRNLSIPLNDFVEAQPDRSKLLISRETARGIEIYAKSDPSRRFSWWVSYAYAKITDHIQTYTFNGRTVLYDQDAPGPYDQRHTIYTDIGYKPGRAWRLNAAWQYHSGTPYTDYGIQEERYSRGNVYYYPTLDTPYSSRLLAYHRLDIRISRAFDISHGTLSFFAEVVNLYNHHNMRTFDWRYRRTGSSYDLIRTPYYWFRLLPSLGIKWEWEF